MISRTSLNANDRRSINFVSLVSAISRTFARTLQPRACEAQRARKWISSEITDLYLRMNGRKERGREGGRERDKKGLSRENEWGVYGDIYLTAALSRHPMAAYFEDTIPL